MPTVRIAGLQAPPGLKLFHLRLCHLLGCWIAATCVQRGFLSCRHVADLCICRASCAVCSVTEILRERAATCLAVAGKFLVLGTDWGNVHVLDSISGHLCKTFQSHEGRVNDISIDKYGESVASCSDDGKVMIRSLYSDASQELQFDRPVKAVAIEPDYSKSTKKKFVIGGMAGELLLTEKGWFGRPTQKVLHAGEGPIQTIKWRGMFIAWANELGVKLFDTSTQQRISYIDRPKNSPRADLYRCRLSWKDDRTLFIGWADSIKVAVIKDNAQTRGQAGSQLPSRYCELIGMFQTDYFVCGLAPFDNDLVSATILLSVSDSLLCSVQYRAQHYT